LPNWKAKNIWDFGAGIAAEIPCVAEDYAERLGIPFGFAQGRLSTACASRSRSTTSALDDKPISVTFAAAEFFHEELLFYGLVVGH
jgi:hypothetical protein